MGDATGKRWSVAAGLADTARRIRLTPDQPVRLASNTRTYTAAAVLRLEQIGRLSLGDPLAVGRINEAAQADGPSRTTSRSSGFRSGC